MVKARPLPLSPPSLLVRRRHVQKAVEAAVTASKELLAKEDVDRDALEQQGMDLSEKMQKVGAAMYKDMPGTEGAPEEVEATEDEGKTDDGAVEGDLRISQGKAALGRIVIAELQLG